MIRRTSIMSPSSPRNLNMSANYSLVPQEISLLFTTLALLIFPLTIFLLTKHFSKSPPLPPGPFAWPILGNIPQLLMRKGEFMHVAYSRLAKTYGSDLISFKFGSQLVIVGSTRAAAMEILKTHDRNLSARYVPDILPAARPHLNNFSVGWTFECNASWKKLRAICRSELFWGKALESQEGIREKKVVEMLEILGKMQGREVSIWRVAFATVFNIMSNILVSMDLLNMESEIIGSGEIGRLFRSASEFQSIPNISDFYPILRFLDLQKLRKKSMDMYYMDSERWETMVKERKERTNGNSAIQKDFIDALMQDGSSVAQIKYLIQELLIAGTDSSVRTIEWTMSELMKNSKCLKMVQEELKREIHSQGLRITESTLSKLKYLEACVKETLRLHPPGPLLMPRRAAESCVVMNYTIPKNSMVLVNVSAIGRDPRVWEDPLVFKPERFLNSSVDFKGNDFDYLPFGGGRRICPGLPMASKHVPMIIASLVDSFEWSLRGENGAVDLDMSEAYDILLRKKEPLVLVPRPKMVS